MFMMGNFSNKAVLKEVSVRALCSPILRSTVKTIYRPDRDAEHGRTTSNRLLLTYSIEGDEKVLKCSKRHAVLDICIEVDASVMPLGKYNN